MIEATTGGSAGHAGVRTWGGELVHGAIRKRFCPKHFTNLSFTYSHAESGGFPARSQPGYQEHLQMQSDTRDGTNNLPVTGPLDPLSHHNTIH